MKALLNFYAPILKDGRSVYYSIGDDVDSDLIGEHKGRLIAKGYIEEVKEKKEKKPPRGKKKGKPAGAK